MVVTALMWYVIIGFVAILVLSLSAKAYETGRLKLTSTLFKELWVKDERFVLTCIRHKQPFGMVIYDCNNGDGGIKVVSDNMRRAVKQAWELMK